MLEVKELHTHNHVCKNWSMRGISILSRKERKLILKIFSNAGSAKRQNEQKPEIATVYENGK